MPKRLLFVFLLQFGLCLGCLPFVVADVDFLDEQSAIQEIQPRVDDKELKNTQISRNAATLLFIVAMMFALFLWIQFRLKTRSNKLLEKLHKELSLKNDELQALFYTFLALKRAI